MDRAAPQELPPGRPKTVEPSAVIRALPGRVILVKPDEPGPAGRLGPGVEGPSGAIRSAPGPGPAPSNLSLADAARLARPGDVVVLAPGIYRQRITPASGGTPAAPIIYRAQTPGTAIVRGSDRWTPVWTPDPDQADLCSTALDPLRHANFLKPALALAGRRCLGQIFLDGQPLLQMACLEDVIRTPGSWWLDRSRLQVHVRWPDHLRTPLNANLEITVRDRLFAPHVRGLGHIHVLGIVFEHCCNQSAHNFWEATGHPQAGAVSCRSGHHWRIEGCTIRHATSIGLDIASEGGRDLEGDQPAPPRERVGFHLIQDNVITDNGECGIAGWRSVGTRIVNNRVERNNCLGFHAVEEAGIKVHYFIDGVIEANLVRDNDGHGIWLDNVWTNSRVTRNTVINNAQSGILIEMGYGPCLVDNNVCAFNRTGEGIYAHDASDVTITNNLLLCNTHFGVHTRTVSDRDVEARPDDWRRVATRNVLVVNNVFVDNYRGHLCMPHDPHHALNNRCDYNLFVNGTQWHWDGLAHHRFTISTSEERDPRHTIIADLGLVVSDAPADRVAGQGVSLSLEQWRELTGHDAHSAAPTASRGRVENGAVTRGALALSARGLFLHVNDPSLLQALRGTHVEQVDLDFHQNPIPESGPLPGPFQVVDPPSRVISVAPAGVQA